MVFRSGAVASLWAALKLVLVLYVYLFNWAAAGPRFARCVPGGWDWLNGKYVCSRILVVYISFAYDTHAFFVLFICTFVCVCVWVAYLWS